MRLNQEQPLPYPDSFYYVDNQKTYKTHYAKNPPGSLDVDRVIQGKPCWKQLKAQDQKKRKILIFADWTLRFLIKKDHIERIMDVLVSDGFTLYCWQNNLEEPENQGPYFVESKKAIPNCITPETPANIAKIFEEEHSLAPHQYQIIEIQDIECLIDASRAKRNTEMKIHYSHFRLLGQIEQEKMLHIMGLSLNPVVFINDIFAPLLNMTKAILFNMLKDINVTIINKFTQATIHDLALNELILNKQFTQHAETFSYQDMEQIENLVLGDLNNIEQTLTLIQKVRQLRRIVFLCCTFTDEKPVKFNGFSIDNKIFISNSTINLSNLQHLAGRATHLSLKGSIVLPENSLFTLCLDKVSSLELNNVNIASQELRKLLKSMPNLQHLQVTNCEHVNNALGDNCNLPNLRILSITDSQCKAGMINSASNLKGLILKNCGDIREVLADKGVKKLGRLDLQDCFIHLDALMNNIDTLCELNMANCRDASPDHALSLLALPLQLKKLCIVECNFNKTSVSKLFSASIHLTALYYENNSPQELLGPFTFSKLEHLIFRDQTIAYADFFSHIVSLKQLERLSLLGMNKDFNVVGLVEFPFLKQLQLKTFQLSIFDLGFLSHFPALEQLHLSNCKVVFNQPSITLARIKQFIYQTEDYKIQSIDFLKKILIQLPGLEALHLPAYTEQCPPLFNSTILHEALQCVPKLKVLYFGKRKVKNSILKSLQSEPSFPLHKALNLPNEVEASFDANESLVHKPKTASFVYSGQNKTKDQAMIIEQLSQYLTLSQDRLHIIPSIQNGICSPLSRYYLTMDTHEWNKLLATIANWDGEKKSLNNVLTGFFESLIQRIQTPISDEINTYLGDALPFFLNDFVGQCVLSNHNHAIALRYVDEGVWSLYNPNFKDGAITLSLPNVLIKIKQSIGNLVCVNTSYTCTKTIIKDTHHFVANGGLLFLLKNLSNRKDIFASTLTLVNLDSLVKGLCIRNAFGVPAWICLLGSPLLSHYVWLLLERFVIEMPDHYHKVLQFSIEVLSPLEKQSYIDKIMALPGANQDVTNKICSVMSATISPQANHDGLEHYGYYENRLKTWDQPKHYPHHVIEYTRSLLLKNEMPMPATHKHLIKLSNSNDIHLLRLQLEYQCISNKKPVFYIDSPDDMTCASTFLKRKGQKGILTAGPGGLLHDFLQKNHAPVLIVNYDNFDTNDLIKHNTLLDKKGSADGTLLPPATLIIGLINPNKPGCYQGADFYGRFTSIETCYFTGNDLGLGIPTIPIISASPNQKTYPIPMFKGLDWEGQLLGKWILHKDAIYFKSGILEDALKSQLPLEIQNGCWDNPAFASFWQQAYLRGYVEYAGRKIKFPSSTVLIKTTGYAWSTLTANATFKSGLHVADKDVHIVNKHQLAAFFQQYQCDKKNQLLTLPGIIEQHRHQILRVNITGALTEDDWVLFLHTCTMHQVKLVAYCAPKVDLPSHLVKEPMDKELILSKMPAHTQLYQTTDVDFSVKTMPGNWLVIDISECTFSDLCLRMEVEFNAKKLNFMFHETQCALIQALAMGQSVILKGCFSEELIDTLLPLLFSRLMHSSAMGELILISEDLKALSFLPIVKQIVSAENKALLLKESYNDHSLFKMLDYEKPIAHLIAGIRYLTIYPDSHPKHNWQGLEEVVPEEKKGTDIANSEVITQAFMNERLNMIATRLEHVPHVLIKGESGVGKTTSIINLFDKPEFSFYQGGGQLSAWAKDVSNKIKILLWDEISLYPTECTAFEGLYHENPAMLIDGEYIPLSSAHKVIFVSNPVGYGCGRKLPAFFERHGNVLIFKQLPQAVIYETIIKPVFANTILVNNSQELGELFLAVYSFFCNIAPSEPLISPRELQMMALLTLSHVLENPEANYQEIGRYYAYSIGKNTVPNIYSAQFEKLFIMNITFKRPLSSHHYFITPSRVPVYQQLHDLLALRQMRKSLKQANDAQLYGGLGGFVLQGEPGIGKSELIVAVLQAHGYQEADLAHASFNDCDNIFYRIPASMDLQEQEQWLRLAFNQGALVLKEETNACSMMESLLNALLMGKTPEGLLPEKPGFMLWGTQNPVEMGGRQSTSIALARRLITGFLPDYEKTELLAILQYKGVSKLHATAMVEAFEAQRAFALKNNCKPIPTFRDLEALIDHAKEYELNEKEQLTIERGKKRSNPHVELSPVAKQPRPIGFFNKNPAAIGIPLMNHSKRAATDDISPDNDKKRKKPLSLSRT